MATSLARFVDLREGEGATVAKAFASLFAVIAAHTLMETARDALFLEKLPATKLPIVYVALAVLAFGLTAASGALVRRFGRRSALLLTLLGAAYGTTLLHFVHRSPAVVFAIYLWTGLLGTVLVTQFWIYAGQLFTVAQGKRVFGPIAAGGVAGAVAGASIASAALLVLPVGSLMLVSAGLFLSTAALLTTLSTDERILAPQLNKASAPSAPAEPTSGKPSAAGEPSASGEPSSPGEIRAPETSGFRLLREYPYLRWIALALAISTAAALMTDYLFKSVAAQRIPKEELGAFFARTYAILNAIALVVQVGIAGLLIRRLGVLASLAVLPLCLAAGGLGTVMMGGTVALALLTKGADGALRHSLNRVGTELAWMPLPISVREGSKELLETVFGRGVQALSAGVLLLLAATGTRSPRVVAGILAVLAGLWILVVIAMRRPYIDLFRQALSKGSIEAMGSADELDTRSIEAVLEALSSRDPSRVIAAMDLLAERKQSRLIPALILYHESEEVLLRALEIIAEGGRRDWIELAERLFSHPSEAVRLAAVRALASVKAGSALEKALSDPCQAVRAHAAFLSAYGDGAGDPTRDPRIKRILEMGGEEGRAAKLALLDAIYDRPDKRFADVLLTLSALEDPEIYERTTRAMGRIKDARFIPILIPRLSARDGRGAVRDAIARQGPQALEALAEALAALETDPRVRLHIPRTIARFGSQRAADLLTDELFSSHPGVIRYKALRGLVRLATEHRVRIDRARVELLLHRNLHEHLRVLSLLVPLVEGQDEDGARANGSGRLLVGLLEDKRQQSLERAFHLLQILHRSEDIRSVYMALRSEDDAERAQAMEFLDALTLPTGKADAPRRTTRELVQLVTDDLSDAERVTRGSAFISSRPRGYDESLRALLYENDATLAAIAAYHALTLGEGALREEVAAACRERPSLGAVTPPSLRPLVVMEATGGE